MIPTESANPPVFVAPSTVIPLTLAPLPPKLSLQSRAPVGASLASARSEVPTLVSGAPPKLTVPVKVVASSTFSSGSSANEVPVGRASLQRQAPVWSSLARTVLVTDAVPTGPQP